MEINVNSNDAWEQWWFEIENYCLRCERFDADIANNSDIKSIMESWVKAAFHQGWESSQKQTLTNNYFQDIVIALST